MTERSLVLSLWITDRHYRVTMTSTRHSRCGIMQAGWLCRQAASSAADRMAWPGRTAWNVAWAGAVPGYPPLPLVRRTAAPATAGICQESAERRRTTVTDWPVDRWTIVPLAATVRTADPLVEGCGVGPVGPVGAGEAETMAVPAGEAEPPEAPPPDGEVTVPHADKQQAEIPAIVSRVSILMATWTSRRAGWLHGYSGRTGR
jgi:hypothetical protein